MKKNTEEIKPQTIAADGAESVAEGGNGNFNDNLHGENLTDRAKVLSPW